MSVVGVASAKERVGQEERATTKHHASECVISHNIPQVRGSNSLANFTQLGLDVLHLNTFLGTHVCGGILELV